MSKDLYCWNRVEKLIWIVPSHKRCDRQKERKKERKKERSSHINEKMTGDLKTDGYKEKETDKIYSS